MRLASLLLLAVCLSPGAAQTLLGNLRSETGAPPYGAGSPVPVTGGRMVLFADSPFGVELHRFDPRSGSLELIADLTPGSASSSGQILATSRGVAWVDLSTASGRALWRTDGTEMGTYSLWSGQVGAGVLFNRELWFLEGGSNTSQQIWRSDGTRAGTLLVVDLSLANYRDIRDLTVLGRTLYFTADTGRRNVFAAGFNGTSLRQLTLFQDFGGSRLASGLAAAGSEVFFLVDAFGLGIELWGSAGTTPTTGMKFESRPGADSLFTSVRDLQSVAGGVLLVLDDGISGLEPWFTDGTLAGTLQLADVVPGAGGIDFAGELPIATFGSHAFFAAGPTPFSRDPWVTDGTPAGTFRLTPGAGDARVANRPFYATPGGVFFNARTSSSGFDVPWFSDGTVAGTRLLTGASPSSVQNAAGFELGSDGRRWFSGGALNRWLLWSTDGSRIQAGPRIPSGVSSEPEAMGQARGRAWFTADVGAAERVVASTDGTAAGTQIVSGPGTALDYGPVGNLIEFGGDAWFSLDLPGPFSGWVRSDGTPSGTRPAFDAAVGVRTSSVARPVVLDVPGLGPQLVFLGFPPGSLQQQLLRTDGTALGTVPLTSAAGGLEVDPFGEAVVLPNGKVVFAGGPSFLGRELWVTDGTVAGTFELADLLPGPGPGSNPVLLTSFGDEVVFFATTPSGTELMVTDGTSAGTRVGGVSFSGDVFGLYDLGGVLHGWVRNGQLLELSQIDLVAGTAVPIPGVRRFPLEVADDTVVSGGRLFLPVEEPRFSGDFELWVTDGTAAGTLRVTTTTPGRQFGLLEGSLVAYGDSGLALFAGYTPALGIQLTVTDGSVDGTTAIGRLSTGTVPGAMSLREIQPFARGVWFAAEAGSEGEEPWAVAETETELPFRERYAQGCAGVLGGRVGQSLEGWPRLGAADYESRVQRGAPQAPAVLLAAFAPQSFRLGDCEIAIQDPGLDVATVALDSSGRGGVSIPVPNDASLVGAELYQQWFVLAPAASGGLPVTVSDAWRIRIGR